MSVIIDIADAVAAELNAAPPETFSETFTAERRVLPDFELADLASLKVTVVPKRLEITASTRSASSCEIAVDIGVQKKLSADPDVEAAALIELVEQIGDYLRQRVLDGAPYARPAAIANDPVYAADHLAEQRTFTSVLTLTYRAMR